MTLYKSIKITPKIYVEDKETLALVYTPGVAASCLEISKDEEKSFDYTNRENSVAVIAFDYSEALKRAIFLKSTLGIDAYPLELKECPIDKIKFVVENIEPTFCAIDLSLIKEDVADVTFDVKIPVLTSNVPDLKKFFLCVSKNLFMFDINKLEGTTSKKSLDLRLKAGGVIETELSENEHIKPVAIASDGSAVLGLGNIGGLAGLPVMEGKAVLFSSLGDVSAMPLCFKTQNPKEVIELILLLENSFSAVNLEDICAPNCFEVENTLIEKANIPIFHDDQHGTAIVVLAALLNAVSVANKKIDEIKIAFSGAGAAAIAVTKLLLAAGVKDITLCDINGAIYKGRKENNSSLEEIAEVTNKSNINGTLKDVIKNADVFIGLSAPDLVTKEMIKSMAKKPIIFALANPTPEILPSKALEYGAFIAASGRSDFPNQVNNSLAFPGLFKGVLDNNVIKITTEMKLNCSFAIASLIKDSELSQEYIIPDALDPQVAKIVAENICVQ
ncbi:MAG: NADP-dependent malic enzyme [Candidatus Gastranaerophilales bacterium]|nr:NADP-dependent malic enzyme [Candidatus Gastranaerophilales bacterium]